MSAKPRANAPGTQTGNVIRDSALGLVPETVSNIIALQSDVWRKSHVTPSLLEIIRLRNANAVNCVFCKATRYDVAREDGLSEDRVAMIGDGYQDSDLTEREKLAIALADSYLNFPVGVTGDLAQRLAAEFSEAEIASMMTALMTFNIASRAAVSIGGMPESVPVTEVPLASSAGE